MSTPLPMPVIVADNPSYHFTGIKKYFYDHDKLTPQYATTLEEVMQLLKDFKNAPLVLTDEFVISAKLGCIQYIKSAVPDIKIIVLATAHVPHLHKYVIKGADAVVSKNGKFSELTAIIHRIAELPKPHYDTLMKEILNPELAPPKRNGDLLNEQETQILLKMADLKTREEIAKKCKISVPSVYNYRTKIVNKLKIAGCSPLDYIAKLKLLEERY